MEEIQPRLPGSVQMSLRAQPSPSPLFQFLIVAYFLLIPVKINLFVNIFQVICKLPHCHFITSCFTLIILVYLLAILCLIINSLLRKLSDRKQSKTTPGTKSYPVLCGLHDMIHILMHCSAMLKCCILMMNKGGLQQCLSVDKSGVFVR